MSILVVSEPLFSVELCVTQVTVVSLVLCVPVNVLSKDLRHVSKIAMRTLEFWVSGVLE